MAMFTCLSLIAIYSFIAGHIFECVLAIIAMILYDYKNDNLY